MELVGDGARSSVHTYEICARSMDNRHQIGVTASVLHAESVTLALFARSLPNRLYRVRLSPNVTEDWLRNRHLEVVTERHWCQYMVRGDEEWIQSQKLKVEQSQNRLEKSLAKLFLRLLKTSWLYNWRSAVVCKFVHSRVHQMDQRL